MELKPITPEELRLAMQLATLKHQHEWQIKKLERELEQERQEIGRLRHENKALRAAYYEHMAAAA